RWAKARLPSEAEWEVMAALDDDDGSRSGGFVEDGRLQPKPPGDDSAGAVGERNLAQMFGGVWEWSQSAYLPYPGYRASEGALGEYNGKFMSNQTVLRGGSCFTSRTHVRASYRNFFHAPDRWQMTGLRLARDAS